MDSKKTIKINFLIEDASRNVVDSIKTDNEVGISLLEAAHRSGVDLPGLCEGSLACSTCHVALEEGWFAKLPPPSEDEEDMLDLAFGLRKTSRLGCQIKLTEEMDEMTVRVPLYS